MRALETCLTTLTPERGDRARARVRASGGAAARDSRRRPSGTSRAGRRVDRKYVICNGDEGDPGAFMDRAVLESDPFRVIEGLAIAAYAVGALGGHRLRAQRIPDRGAPRARGDCHGRSARASWARAFWARRSASRCRCARARARSCAARRRRSSSRSRASAACRGCGRPTRPQSGLWGKPTLINNVETLACLPWIFRRGPEAFAALGTATSKGTKVFSLTGKVKRGGLIEVPMGITIREIVEDIGGGMQGRPALQGRARRRAVRRLHPGAAWPTRRIDYRGAGVDGRHHGIGRPGGARRSRLRRGDRPLLPALHAERVVREVHVLPRRHQADARDPRAHLRRAAGWRATSQTLDELSSRVKTGSLCGLGQTAPNPVLTTLRYFRDEYEAHIRERRCPAAVVQGAHPLPGARQLHRVHAVRAGLPGRRDRCPAVRAARGRRRPVHALRHVRHGVPRERHRGRMMARLITLTIDGQATSVEAGTTILEAARTLGIRIPTLCHVDGFPPSASCFLCAVQIEGKATLVAVLRHAGRRRHGRPHRHARRSGRRARWRWNSCSRITRATASARA